MLREKPIADLVSRVWRHVFARHKCSVKKSIWSGAELTPFGISILMQVSHKLLLMLLGFSSEIKKN